MRAWYLCDENSDRSEKKRQPSEKNACEFVVFITTTNTQHDRKEWFGAFSRALVNNKIVSYVSLTSSNISSATSRWVCDSCKPTRTGSLNTRAVSDEWPWSNQKVSLFSYLDKSPPSPLTTTSSSILHLHVPIMPSTSSFAICLHLQIFFIVVTGLASVGQTFLLTGDMHILQRADAQLPALVVKQVGYGLVICGRVSDCILDRKT